MTLTNKTKKQHQKLHLLKSIQRNNSFGSAAESRAEQKNRITSSDSTTAASSVAAQETARCGKPFTDGGYLKESFIKTSDFKNKTEIIKKRKKDAPLSAATIKDSGTKLATEISSQKIQDITSAPAHSIACDASMDLNHIEQIALLCRCVSSDGRQEEIIEFIPLKDQTWGEDICEAVLSC